MAFVWQHMWPPCLHISICFVGVLTFGLALEELPATCRSLHPPGFPGQKQHLPAHKRDAQAPSTVDRRRKAFLNGAKMLLQLSVGFGKEPELFL